MTDYREEQINEIEALESIYPDEIEIIQREPYHDFTVDITSSDADNQDEQDQVSCSVQFTYVEKYPDEAPLFEITTSEELEDCEEDITTVINQTIEENLGMVMVFTIVSAVQEKLTDIVENAKRRRREEKERREHEIEEAERKKFEGTKVSVETFLTWKKAFDAEMIDMKKITTELERSKKLTGKELFMQDASMNDSDVKFLQSEGDAVEVDESLFQDMDDLDLDIDLEEEDVGD
ncbi:hypothetical protein ScPMuIL_013365 [Solemya velum]